MGSLCRDDARHKRKQPRPAFVAAGGVSRSVYDSEKKEWSGTRDSNPRPPAWEASALPTELVPQKENFPTATADACQRVIERAATPCSRCRPVHGLAPPGARQQSTGHRCALLFPRPLPQPKCMTERTHGVIQPRHSQPGHGQQRPQARVELAQGASLTQRVDLLPRLALPPRPTRPRQGRGHGIRDLRLELLRGSSSHGPTLFSRRRRAKFLRPFSWGRDANPVPGGKGLQITGNRETLHPTRKPNPDPRVSARDLRVPSGGLQANSDARTCGPIRTHVRLGVPTRSGQVFQEGGERNGDVNQPPRQAGQLCWMQVPKVL